MSAPLVVSIPHRLGREEAVRRLKTGLGRAAASIPVMQVEEERWSGDSMNFRIRALGQIAERSGRRRRGSRPGRGGAALAVAALCRDGAGHDQEARAVAADQGGGKVASRRARAAARA